MIFQDPISSLNPRKTVAHIVGEPLLIHGEHSRRKRDARVLELLDVVGITPDNSIITYCGGGPLSAGMYFTFKYVLEYPDVRNYTISYLGWIADPRELSVDFYDDDQRLLK